MLGHRPRRSRRPSDDDDDGGLLFVQLSPPRSRTQRALGRVMPISFRQCFPKVCVCGSPKDAHGRLVSLLRCRQHREDAHIVLFNINFHNLFPGPLDVVRSSARLLVTAQGGQLLRSFGAKFCYPGTGSSIVLDNKVFQCCASEVPGPQKALRLRCHGQPGMSSATEVGRLDAFAFCVDVGETGEGDTTFYDTYTSLPPAARPPPASLILSCSSDRRTA